MKKGPRSLAASVRARLLRLAHERGEEFQFVLMHFVLERLLYRLSVSDRAGDFVLKGAMLLEALMDVRHRATKDLDLLGFGPNDPPRLVEVSGRYSRRRSNRTALSFSSTRSRPRRSATTKSIQG